MYTHAFTGHHAAERGGICINMPSVCEGRSVPTIEKSTATMQCEVLPEGVLEGAVRRVRRPQ
jgi:hypothetical protein